MSRYVIDCWRSVAKRYEIEAESKVEAERKARSLFDGEDLNNCAFVDCGCEIQKEPEPDRVPDAVPDAAPDAVKDTAKDVKSNAEGAGADRRSRLEEHVRTLVSEVLCVDRDRVQVDSSFVDDLRADSLDLVELLMGFEEEFGIAISEEDVSSVTTVGQAVDYLAGRGF